MREPRVAEAAYLRWLRSVWRIAQDISWDALAPLLNIWPFRGDAVPGVARPRPPVLTVEMARRIWPGLDPVDVVNWAPWATSRAEVMRIIGGEDLEERVRQSIEAAKRAAPLDDTRLAREAAPPGPLAFVARPPTVLLGPDGLPLPGAPHFRVVNRETIRRQLDWLDVRLGELVTENRLASTLDQHGRRVDRWVTSQLERVYSIPPRDLPGVAQNLDTWRALNLDLIDSGVRGTGELRSVLGEVDRVVNEAFDAGLRVEVLAHNLATRFEVTDSRAALIARDQVLKLAGQINRSRQQGAGITHYRWTTSGDERVRPYHWRLNGTRQSWDAPPEVSEDGRREHPGGDYQCRCTAVPLFS